MGACTFTVDSDGYSPIDSSSGWMVRGTLNLSSSYATNGDTVTPALFGLGEIKKMILDAAGGYVFSPFTGNTAVQAWYTGTASDDAFNEVTPTTDLHTVNVRCIIYGL